MCRNYNQLPVQGGVLDQPANLMRAMLMVGAARAEAEEWEQKKRASKAKR